MADWNTVTLVPSMRCSFCPSIKGSHWLKFFSNPVRYRSIFFQSICRRTQDLFVVVSQLLPRWRCRKASDALLQRSMASSGSISPFSFISFPIQLPVRKVKSGKLWWTVPLTKGFGLESFTNMKEVLNLTAVQLGYLIVIIFLCMAAESSFLMRLMFPAHWNFSELMKKMGCLTLAKISSPKGNIQASSATPHLDEEKLQNRFNLVPRLGCGQKRNYFAPPWNPPKIISSPELAN